MKTFSLGLLITLLVLGIIINVWQGGAATTLTYLGYAPLALYLIIVGIAAAVNARKSQ